MAKSKYLYDNFASTSGKWGTTNAVTGVVTGGQMRLKPTSGYDYVYSSLNYDMRGSYLGFKLVQNNIIGTGSNTLSLYSWVDASNHFGFIISGGRTVGNAAAIVMRERVGGTSSDTSFTYDPAVHVWFRIREASGTLYWETSANGSSWTVQRSKSSSLVVSSVQCILEAGFWGSEAGTTFATIDDFNLWAGVPSQPKAEELTDSFGSFDTDLWYQSGSTWSVSGGALSTVPSADYDSLSTLEKWDLTDSHFAFQLVQNASAGNTPYGGSVSFQFRARPATGDNYVEFLMSGGPNANCVLRERVAGANSDTSFTYNAARDKWLRLRHSGSTVYWETSFDGATWSIKRSKSTSLDLTAVDCQFISGFWDAADEPDVGTLIIDNFNLLNTNRLREIGWYVGPSLPMGAINGGTVQPRTFFQEADWLWEPIPASPVLDPESSGISYYLGYPGGNHGISWGWYGNAVIYPNKVTTETPRYRVRLIGESLHPDWGLDDHLLDGYRIPIPLGTQIPPGSDGHLCVMDPVQGMVFSFWQAHYNAESDEWTATTGSVTRFGGDGRDLIGSSTATNLSRAAGVISLAELEAGEIPHAIFVASNMCRPGAGWVSPSNPGGTPPFRYPAMKSDGRNLASVPVEYTVVEGSRLQLDPSIDLSAIPGITPLELAIGKAWQVYGAYVGDQGGNAWPPTVGAGGFELWQGQDYTGYVEAENPEIPVPPQLAAAGVGWDYFDLSHIPWEGNIRVLKNWDGSA